MTTWLRPSAGSREAGAVRFILALALANTALFQWPLYALAASTRASFDWSSALAIGTLFVFQLTISPGVLSLCALVSIRLLKLACPLFAVGNAAAGTVDLPNQRGELRDPGLDEYFKYMSVLNGGAAAGILASIDKLTKVVDRVSLQVALLVTGS